MQEALSIKGWGSSSLNNLPWSRKVDVSANLSNEDVFERHRSTGKGIVEFLGNAFAQSFGQIVSIGVEELSETNFVASKRIKYSKGNSLISGWVAWLKNVFAHFQQTILINTIANYWIIEEVERTNILYFYQMVKLLLNLSFYNFCRRWRLSLQIWWK